jgi:5'-nucleotidase
MGSRKLAVFACVAFSLAAPVGAEVAVPLSGERTITLLATNDIHGGVEPSQGKDGKPIGGLALFGGIVSAIRQGVARERGDKGGVLVVDAGDQFQGTLISNFDEGQLVFAAMNSVGYDAAIPGNHDYDFGPIGWLDDQVTPKTVDQNPRGALLRVVGQAKFPLLSANTFFTSSLVDAAGAPVAVDGSGCKPKSGQAIDWSKARRPSFLVPYLIKQVAGVRVALVGIDNPVTPTTTTPANVTDLCFRDEADAYLDLRARLEGQADVFVILLHDGDIGNELNAKNLLTRLTDASLPPNRVDAVIAGHTHAINNASVAGVPYIQSGSGGQLFGRIDLTYDPAAHAVTKSKTRALSGLELRADSCPKGTDGFCQAGPGGLSYEGEAVRPNADIQALIAAARANIAPLAGRKLGTASREITVNRIDESPLADALTDALRSLSGAEVAFMNTGGIRAPIEPGELTYETFFRVLPFNNHGLTIGPMPAEQLLGLLERSAAACGLYGALMESGLRVSFARVCGDGGTGAATLQHVETVSGEVILDAATGVKPAAGRVFRVATLDFLAAGGSGYSGFAGTPVLEDLGVLREAMADEFTARPIALDGSMDGRWKAVPAPQVPKP